MDNEYFLTYFSIHRTRKFELNSRAIHCTSFYRNISTIYVWTSAIWRHRFRTFMHERNLPLPLSGSIQQTTYLFLLISSINEDLTLHAVETIWRQFAWNVKSCILGKIRKTNTLKCRLLKILPRVLRVKDSWKNAPCRRVLRWPTIKS